MSLISLDVPSRQHLMFAPHVTTHRALKDGPPSYEELLRELIFLLNHYTSVEAGSPGLLREGHLQCSADETKEALSTHGLRK